MQDNLYTNKNNSEGEGEGGGKAGEAYIGVDIGSISTKGVCIDAANNIIARSYLWTEGNPVEAAKKVVAQLHEQLSDAGGAFVQASPGDETRVQASPGDEYFVQNANYTSPSHLKTPPQTPQTPHPRYVVCGVGTTGSARRLVGAMLDACVIKNEITTHAVGTTHLHPDVRTILEIGGQDSKIILVEGGIATDYAMNTLCAAGTGSFLSSQATRLGVAVEDFGAIALTSKKPANIAARCTVFAESDLVHKIQVGYERQDIIAGLCRAVASNYLNNVGKGKKIIGPVVFQGGVSKNIGVVAAFEELLGCKVHVDQDGHLMGAYGAALLAADAVKTGAAPALSDFDFDAVADFDFATREIECNRCSNACEIICVYRNGKVIDSWGNRCEKGAIPT